MSNVLAVSHGDHERPALAEAPWGVRRPGGTEWQDISWDDAIAKSRRA